MNPIIRGYQRLEGRQLYIVGNNNNHIYSVLFLFFYAHFQIGFLLNGCPIETVKRPLKRFFWYIMFYKRIRQVKGLHLVVLGFQACCSHEVRVVMYMLVTGINYFFVWHISGCGNGMLLIELYKKGFNNLNGVDYSKNAIDLATAISEREDCSINFFVGNILEDVFETTYKVALDKGTYDAISLDPEDPKTKRLTYITNIHKILADKGIFIITSCNWTDIELIQQFNGKY